MKLILFDTNCLAHKCVRIAEKHSLDAEQQQLYFCTVILWADAAGFIPKLRDRADVVSCWLTDSKPYWRTQYKPDYKGGRSRTDATIKSLDIFHQCFEVLGIPVLKFPQYEADDIAGAIVQLWQQGNRVFDEVFLATVDSDWQGLVINDDVAWINLLPYEPRCRRTAECYQWLVKDWNKAAKYKQRAWALPGFQDYKSSHIWEWKGSSGDKSDNISVGEGSWLTDLFEQPDKWNLSVHSKQQIFDFISENVRRIKNDWFEAEQAIHQTGMPLPIESLAI